MKLFFLYWWHFIRGYRDSVQALTPFYHKLSTPEGRAEWWGYADGRAFRVRTSTAPFCRACGQPLRAAEQPHYFDANLGLLCKHCEQGRHLQIGTDALGDCPRETNDLV